jgi:hypothetical protein
MLAMRNVYKFWSPYLKGGAVWKTRRRWEDNINGRRTLREVVNAYKHLVVKSERKTPVGRSKLRWEDHINCVFDGEAWRIRLA